LPELSDEPPAVVRNISFSNIHGLSVDGNTEAESVLRFIDTQQVLVTAPRVLTPAKTFLQLEGAGNAEIIVNGGDLTQAAEPVAFRSGAEQGAVKIS